MTTRLLFLNGGETVTATPTDSEALAEMLHYLFRMRHRLGSTAFGTACAAATTAFDAESLGVGTVVMLTAFGAQ